LSEHVFISYAQQHDTAFATRLHDKLEAEGFTVRLDRDEAKAPAEARERMEEGIRDCWVVIFVVTKNSVDSARCREVGNRALSLKKPVLPLIVEPVQPPSPLDRRQSIDFTRDFAAALAKLRRHLTWLRSTRGELQTLRDRLADLERELAAGSGAPPEPIRAEIQELHELISQKERIGAQADASHVADHPQRAVPEKTASTKETIRNKTLERLVAEMADRREIGSNFNIFRPVKLPTRRDKHFMQQMLLQVEER
jgi:hypothetical protein